MERRIDMNEVSDGRLYKANDLVKADCGGCQGCSDCCQGMGSSITLDPLDLFWLYRGLQLDFDQLLEGGKIELNIVDGLILPNLKMTGPQEACVFLNREGRCSIHSLRPGICRLFPLGRLYENSSFQYFLQVHECPKEDRRKIKIKKWLDLPDPGTYEQFVRDWHYCLKALLKEVHSDPERIKPVSMELLNRFYRMPWDPAGDFYGQFYERLEAFRPQQADTKTEV